LNSKFQPSQMNHNSTIQPANEDEDEDVPYDFQDDYYQDGTSKISLYLLGSKFTFNIDIKYCMSYYFIL